MFHNEPHPVNAISVAQRAAEILTDAGGACAVLDDLMRGPDRVAFANAVVMMVTPTEKPATARVGAARVRERVINGALARARHELEARYGPPPCRPAEVNWDRPARQECPA